MHDLWWTQRAKPRFHARKVSTMSGSLVGAPGINEGFTTGMHIFDIWNGGGADITVIPAGGGDPRHLALHARPS